MKRSGQRGVHDIEKGDIVALTGKFLRDTGQMRGGEGRRKWKVLEVRGDVAFVDEPAAMNYWTEEELRDDPLLRYRKFNTANLYRVGTLSSRNAL